MNPGSHGLRIGNYPPSSALLQDVVDVSALAQIFSASSLAFSSERSA
jgi:hypothetical protein